MQLFITKGRALVGLLVVVLVTAGAAWQIHGSNSEAYEKIKDRHMPAVRAAVQGFVRDRYPNAAGELEVQDPVSLLSMPERLKFIYRFTAHVDNATRHVADVIGYYDYHGETIDFRVHLHLTEEFLAVTGQADEAGRWALNSKKLRGHRDALLDQFLGY